MNEREREEAHRALVEGLILQVRHEAQDFSTPEVFVCEVMKHCVSYVAMSYGRTYPELEFPQTPSDRCFQRLRREIENAVLYDDRPVVVALLLGEFMPIFTELAKNAQREFLAGDIRGRRSD